MEPPAKKQRNASGSDKIPCKYGKKCYRKNPEHRKQYRHDDDSSKKASSENVIVDAINDPEEAGKITQTKKSTQPSSTKCKTENKVPTSKGDIREWIEELFLVRMPQDFFDFWQFCKQINESRPTDALCDALGLKLVGPFDALSGKLTDQNVKSVDDLLCHWRYYYDPPEMQTVLQGDDDKLYHVGYFRDDPKEMPVFVASNSAQESCKISKVGGNLFTAVSREISMALRRAKDDATKSKLKKLNGALIEFAETKKNALDEGSKKRPKAMAATFHGAGMVVPYNSKTDVGYRPLPVSYDQLKSILKKISTSSTDELRAKNMIELQNIIMNVHLANDECDYGMGLELGLNLFCFGCPTLHSMLLRIITVAYQLLDREVFGQIATAHLKRRKKGADLSAIEAS
ncbi:histone PARylation factor 1-like isoform X2 [Ornithodoros turicata]|uniref:histone PARylation factor 1-like isoform X2 n=1 Tax=Ornithodoros turicata TaxID=34597 RepID=UPI003138A8F7